MDTNAPSLLNPRKILIPILLGLAVVAILMYKSGDELNFDTIADHVKTAKPMWLIAAVLVLLVRDFGYIYRIRSLTQKALSWKSSTYIILLWEFASAITPSVVGGTAVAMFIINREGISFGKSLAYVMLTAVLDNLFFVFAATFILIFAAEGIYPAFPEGTPLVGNLHLHSVFVLSIALIAVYTLIMAFGLFFKPKAFKWLLMKLASFPLLSRWKKSAEINGDEMIIASEELRGMSLSYWLKASLSTLFVWTARYFMLNCLIAAFSDISIWGHINIFGKQVVLWIVLLVSPTPGGSGIAEGFFSLFFKEYLGGFSLAVAVLWRLMTYYLYLLLGAFAISRWSRKILTRSLANKANSDK